MTAILERMKAAAEKAIKSGKLGIQGMIDAYNEIANINQQLADAGKNAVAQFKQLNTRKLVAGSASPRRSRRLYEHACRRSGLATPSRTRASAVRARVQPEGDADRPVRPVRRRQEDGVEHDQASAEAAARNSSQRRGPNAGLAFGS